MKHLRYTFTVSVLLVSLLSTACGSGGSAPATQAPVSVAATQPPATAIPTQPAAAQPTAQPAATATLDPTRKALDLSRTNQPGSTLAGSVVEQIVFGEGYDNKQNQIVSPAFVFPVAIPKVWFGFGVANGTQALNFTETLKFNGEAIPLPVTKFSVPPSGAGQKQLRVKGLAVKAGVQFPVGQYQIEVYSEGQLVQQGIFEVHETAGTSMWLGPSASRQLATWSGAGRAQVAPDIFVVTEEEVEIVSNETDYYVAEEIQAAYEQLEHVDELFEPLPAEVQETIEADAQREAEVACAAIGGVFEATSSQCLVNDIDPATACQALGGIYDTTTGSCSFGESDSDGDGWLDSVDNCPWVANVDQGDADADNVGDACDGGDGTDSDGDGWLDSVDNCPWVANADQGDTDADNVGDACDGGEGSGGNDSDGDGVPDDQDQCAEAPGDLSNAGCPTSTEEPTNAPDTPEPTSEPTAVPDVDSDGWADDADNCPNDANPGQEDSDSNGIGDACDAPPDGDGDGIPDASDNCPSQANPGQEDSDSNGIGDACDAPSDGDGDGVPDASDNCLSQFNPGQEDSDSDGIGDACDSPLALQVDVVSVSRVIRLERQPYAAKLATAAVVSA